MKRQHLAMVLVAGWLSAGVSMLLAIYGKHRTHEFQAPDTPPPEVAVRMSVSFPHTIASLALTPDGKHLAIVHPLRIWDLENNREVTGFHSPNEAEEYLRVAISPDGKAIAVGGAVKRGDQQAGVVRVWDLETRQSRWSASVKWDVHCLAWSQEGSRLAAGSGYDGTITLWNADGTNERVAWRPPSEGGSVIALAWSHDGKRIAHAIPFIAYIWDVESGREVVVAVQPTLWNPLELWQERPLAVTQEPCGDLTAFAFALDNRSVFVGKRLIAAREERVIGNVWVWDLESNHESRRLANSPSGVLELALGPSGRSLVTANGSPPVASELSIHAHGWDTISGRRLWTLSARTDEWPGDGRFAITPDHKRLALRRIELRGAEKVWCVNVYDLPPPP